MIKASKKLTIYSAVALDLERALSHRNASHRQVNMYLRFVGSSATFDEGIQRFLSDVPWRESLRYLRLRKRLQAEAGVMRHMVYNSGGLFATSYFLACHLLAKAKHCPGEYLQVRSGPRAQISLFEWKLAIEAIGDWGMAVRLTDHLGMIREEQIEFLQGLDL